MSNLFHEIAQTINAGLSVHIRQDEDNHSLVLTVRSNTHQAGAQMARRPVGLHRLPSEDEIANCIATLRRRHNVEIIHHAPPIILSNDEQ